MGAGMTRYGEPGTRSRIAVCSSHHTLQQMDTFGARRHRGLG